jgi:hypothetical protein
MGIDSDGVLVNAADDYTLRVLTLLSSGTGPSDVRLADAEALPRGYTRDGGNTGGGETDEDRECRDVRDPDANEVRERDAGAAWRGVEPDALPATGGVAGPEGCTTASVNAVGSGFSGCTTRERDELSAEETVVPVERGALECEYGCICGCGCVGRKP